MIKRPIILIINVIAYLAIYQQVKHLFQDVTGNFLLTTGIVVRFGEGWESTGGEGTIAPREMLIIKYDKNKEISGLERIKYGIAIGDTILFKYYGDGDPIFLKYNNKPIETDFADVFANFLLFTLIYIYLYFFSIRPLFYKYCHRSKS